MTSFLQTKTWEKFQNSLGRKTFRLALSRVEGVDDVLVIKNNLPLGKSYLYAPRGQVTGDRFQDFLKETSKIAQQENSIFLRIDPEFDFQFSIFPAASGPRYGGGNFQSAPPLQPRQTLLLDLSPTPDELLAQMKPKTRYNIKVAQKHQVKIRKSKNPKDIEIFWKLATETSRRDKFRLHPQEYYQKMLEVAGAEDKLVLYLAEYLPPDLSARASATVEASAKGSQNTPISAILVWFENETAYYLHGASSSLYKIRGLSLKRKGTVPNVMANYLIHWQAILDAKEHGCKYYDFWGISEEKWPGITRFKMGFAPAGKIVNYPEAKILVFQPFWYRIYHLTKKLKT